MKQAYGSEPILFSSSPITPPSVPEKTSKKRRRYKGRRLLLFGVILLVASILTATLIARRNKDPNVFPAAIYKTAEFILYHPTWLPEGYYVDKSSVSATPQVATFSINSPNGKALVVTEQPQPVDDTEITSFYSQNITNSREVSSGDYKITLGQFETTSFAGVTTGNTWILVRSVTSIDQDQLERLSLSFDRKHICSTSHGRYEATGRYSSCL